MCGRYSIGKSATELATELRASLATDDIKPRFNVAPTQDAPMLVALPDRRLGLARFGWTLEGKKGLLLNARSETAPKNGLFARALERRRALIPADGFYEWKLRGEGKKAPKDAFFLHQDGAILTFAGLYYVAKGDEGAKHASFVILTGAPTPEVAAIHDRMPIVVPPALRDAWLDVREPADQVLAALRAQPPRFAVRHVSSKVGSPAIDEPSLHDPV